MNAFDILGDPVRRRLVELLAETQQSAGELTARIGAEFGISQPAVSNQLRVLRDAGFARVEPAGSRRIYSLDPSALVEVDRWLERYRGFWTQRLDALDTELARGRARS